MSFRRPASPSGYIFFTTDVTTIDALKLVAKVVFCEVFQSSRRKYRGTGMIKTVSKPLAHLNFLSGVNCYDIGSNPSEHNHDDHQLEYEDHRELHGCM